MREKVWTNGKKMRTDEYEVAQWLPSKGFFNSDIYLPCDKQCCFLFVFIRFIYIAVAKMCFIFFVVLSIIWRMMNCIFPLKCSQKLVFYNMILNLKLMIKSDSNCQCIKNLLFDNLNKFLKWHTNRNLRLKLFFTSTWFFVRIFKTREMWNANQWYRGQKTRWRRYLSYRLPKP